MGKKILLADDSITIQKVIELTFSDEDFEVVTVGNGRLALEKLDEVRPDVVLCDIIMPEKDGYEVCDQIKKHPSLGHVPVLLLTGAFEPFDQERAARVGCDGFLAKPFEPQALITKVKDLLNQTASRPRAASTAGGAAEFVMPQAKTTPGGLGGVAPAPPVELAFEPAAFAEPEPAFEAAAPEPAYEPELPQAGTYNEPMDLTPEPGTPPPPYAPPEGVTSGAPSSRLAPEEPVEASADEFMPLMDDEAESLQPPGTGAEAPRATDPLEGARPIVFQADEAPPWSSPTVELPLETRAQASVAAASPQAARSVFTEAEAPSPAFEPPPAEAADEASFEPDFGEPAAMPSPEPPVPAPPPPAAFAPAPEPAFASFADLRPEEPVAPAAAPSHAAEVAVPIEQVAQIAQRVVAQISEKVVREVAWEVVPDLAEALIKKEIERLRAELDKI